MVEVPVAENQTIGLARIYAEQAVICLETLAGKSEIHQDLPPLITAERVQV
jgi:hypothetical protein